MTGIPYESVADATPFRGPKGMLPWIEHDGRTIGDSGFIIECLEQRFGCNPNASLARRGVLRHIDAQGTGRHARQEVHSIGIRDVGALADQLAARPFLMGESPTEIDAVAYVERMRRRFFG